MNILDNKLVKTYFWCKQPCPDGNLALHPGTCMAVMSERVLKAMQEPIKKGELYLEININDDLDMELYLEINDDLDMVEDLSENQWVVGWHPDCLRLPDKFQKPPEKADQLPDYQLKCDNCEGHFVHKCTGKKDAAPWINEVRPPEACEKIEAYSGCHCEHCKQKHLGELPEDFRLWGYSLKELRSMRDFAETRGWRVPV